MAESQFNSIADHLIEECRKRLIDIPGVVGVGIGVAVHESSGEPWNRDRWQQGVHWTHYALKVFVEKKRKKVRKPHRIPKFVDWVLGDTRPRRYRFPVDICTCAGLSYHPEAAQLQDGQTDILPRSGRASPGNRVLVGRPARQQPSGVGLPAGLWAVGTATALAGSNAFPFLVTAGHVMGDVYQPTAVFPTLAGFTIGFQEEAWVSMPFNGGPMRPNAPRTSNGIIVDAVALPLPRSGVNLVPGRMRVASVGQLSTFVNNPARLLVERDGAATNLTGTIEAVFLPSRDFLSMHGLPQAAYPPVISFRFDGANSEPGDSGGPLVVRINGVDILVGLHFAEIQAHLPRSLSLSIPAALAFGQVGLRPL